MLIVIYKNKFSLGLTSQLVCKGHTVGSTVEYFRAVCCLQELLPSLSFIIKHSWDFTLDSI